MLTSHVVDSAHAPWKRSVTEGIEFECQVLLSGDDGGPEALRFRFDPCPSVYAHMHLTSQFQVLLAGEMNMPRGKMDLRPLAVHYTDHNVPYGPFSTDKGHDMLVLHPKQGGLISMAHTEARRAIHLGGRLLVGGAAGAEWHAWPAVDGRWASLLPAGLGPEAVLVELPPGGALPLNPPRWGRYEVVVEGSVRFGDGELEPPGFRYVRGDQLPPASVAGERGATVLCLSFDADVDAGGLVGSEIALMAADGMAQAI
jgi:hypothetical protein